MKRLVILFGPPAVGKMSVGRELEKISGLKLFHNHMTIEIVLPFFEFGSKEFNKLTGSFRRQILEQVASSDLPGLIFTFVWDFNQESEKKFIDSLTSIFHDVGGESYYVELEASQKERLSRNRGEDRLLEKPSKRNLEWSDNNLITCDEKYKLNLDEGDFFYYDSYLKINNEELSATETAKRIFSFIEP
jgi:hypothetical protein